MPVRFIIFLAYMWATLHTVFALAQLDSSLLDLQVNAAGTSGEIDALNRLPFLTIINMQEVPLVPFALPIPSNTFFTDLQTLLLWNYPFFNGNWFFVKLFLLTPISIATMILMAVTVGPLIIAAGSLIVSTFIGPVARVLTGGLRGVVSAG